MQARSPSNPIAAELGHAIYFGGAPVSERPSTLGLGGYDAVSYFSEGRPRPGNFEFKTSWQGMTYCFFSKDNLDKFVKNPESFLPQFGGNCAFACGLFGGKRPGSPQIWKIVDGQGGKRR